MASVPQDGGKLHLLIHDDKLEELKAFLSANNLDISDPVFWFDEERYSPIKAALMFGEVEITRFLLEHFPKVFSIDHCFRAHHGLRHSLLHFALVFSIASNTCNRGADLVKSILDVGASPNGNNSDGSSPLHVLFTIRSSDISILRCLIKYGADVNAVDSAGNTPLLVLVTRIVMPPSVHREAICCLIDHGADVNAANELGVTPLMAATKLFFELPTIQCLLEKGADPNILDRRGYSVLHHVVFHKSSVRPTYRNSLQELLSKGANPLFKSAPCSNEERQQYVPCPLYIAASKGVKDDVEEFLKHPQCPPVCKAEAYLLLASTEIDEIGLSLRSQELWSKALCIYEENNIHPAYLPPIEAYGNCVEIQSVKEFQELVSSSTSVDEVHYQSLIIRERCIGMGSACRSLIEALMARATTLHDEGEHSEGERLFLHAMDIVIHALDHVNVHSDDIMDSDHKYALTDYSYFMSEWLEELCSEYVPSFERFAECSIRLYNSLCRHIPECKQIEHILHVVLLLSVACEATLNSGSSRVHCAIEELGHQFVSKLLQDPNTLSLLLESVSLVLLNKYDFVVPSNFYHGYLDHLDRRGHLMSNALLRWGAYELIDQPNSEGQRFLHLAVQSKYAAEVVPILLEYSPHLDAVDADGKTAFDLCTSDELRSLFPSTPHPLSCQAAKVVVSENIPYQELDLPAHIKSLISLHNCHHMHKEKGNVHV